MTPDAFVALVGPEILHITPATNASGIERDGLMPAAALARRAGMSADGILLRNAPVQLGAHDTGAILTHQRPLLMGRKQEKRFLDGHTLKSWAAQLDHRIFFFPARSGAAFARAAKGEPITLRLDARSLFERYKDHLFLAPINSGNAARKPARRGDWLYVSANASVETFRGNRMRRGLVQGRDRVAEISLTCPLPAPELKALLL